MLRHSGQISLCLGDILLPPRRGRLATILGRFLAPDHGIRPIKDAMSREILAALDKAKIGIASGTYAIVEVPPIRIEGLPVASAGA